MFHFSFLWQQIKMYRNVFDSKILENLLKNTLDNKNPSIIPIGLDPVTWKDGFRLFYCLFFALCKAHSLFLCTFLWKCIDCGQIELNLHLIFLPWKSFHFIVSLNQKCLQCNYNGLFRLKLDTKDSLNSAKFNWFFFFIFALKRFMWLHSCMLNLVFFCSFILLL